MSEDSYTPKPKAIYVSDIHPSFPEGSQVFPRNSSASQNTTVLNQDNISGDGRKNSSASTSSMKSNKLFRVYPSRYYVLIIYSLILAFQCTVWNTWGPISESALYAFPSWDEATIATLANWGPISYVLFAIPTSWGVSKYGLRPVMVLFTLCTAAAHSLRCITTEETAFTVLAHVCGIINGIEATVLLAGTMIPAVWFPASQRITATAFSSVLNQMGSGLSFLEPLIVESPSNDTTPQEIRDDIRTLMFIDFGVAVAFFICVAIYFPSSPPSPPSPSSEVPRYNFSEGYKEITRNMKFWQLIIPYAVFTGVSMVWLGVINFSLQELGLSQDEIGWIGVLNSITVGIVCLITSRLADIFYGYLKVSLLALMCLSSVFYIWFMLLSLDVITSSKAQVYITVLGGQAFNFASTPFFYELCVEAVYPSPEAGVGAIATLSNNFIAMLFLFLFYIPGISDGGNEWMTYLLVGSNTIAILPVLFIKEEYKRSKLDRKNIL